MKTPLKTDIERLRLQAVLDSQLLDTPPEEDFDNLTRLAAVICKTPTAFISLVDDKRQWFKSKHQIDLCETPRSEAFCTHTIQNTTEALVVENTLEDSRFIFNPLVTGEPFIRFYAGVPVTNPDGYALGTLCVIDKVPRHLDKSQIESLKILSKQVAALIELRRTSHQNQLISHRYRQILEQAADGIYIYDTNGRILGANRTFCEIAGRSENEVLMMNVRDFFATENPKVLERSFEQLRKGKVLVNEYNVVRPDKSIVPVELNEKLIDENTLQGIMRDISERKKVESELSETRQLFSLFINNSPTMIYMKDSAGRFVFTNETFEQTFKVREADAIGKTNNLVLPEELAESVRQTDERVLRTGQVAQTTEILPMPDGTTCHWLSHKFLIKNQKGEKFIGAIAIDITDRHKMEIELKTARDSALEAARLKSAFLANISHEIRTPMNAVIGMTELLSNTALDNTQQEYVKIIRHSSDSFLTIINDILDLAKIEAGKMQLNSSDFDLRELVESAAENFAARAGSKNIEIAALIDREVPQIVCGDAGRLRQVLTNLIGNSVKFTEKGEIRIKIKVRENSDDKTTVYFSIADTGIGISRENLKYLFQPFMQVDSSHTRQFGGTGLGLALSKQIVELMNGEMSVESELKKGSVFNFTVQFDKAVSTSETKQAQKVFAGKVKKLENKRILIVDINEISRQTLDFYASSWNMKTAEAASGAACLEKLRAAQSTGAAFDFAVIDANLIDLDSPALIKMIKSDARLSTVEIILTTSHEQRGDSEKARQAGAANCLAKPLRGTQFLDCLTAIIENPSSHRINSEPVTNSNLRETKVEPDKTVSSVKEGKLSVLVVEDNDINRRIVLTQLKRNGIDADFAVDGIEALEKIDSSNYQLVLMDCQMPRLDGYETTAKIRRIEQAKREDGEEFVPLVIIALTANTLDGEREKCLAAGMSDYLSKPFNSSDLLAVINHWRDFIYDYSESLINPNKSFFKDSAKIIDHTFKSKKSN